MFNTIMSKVRKIKDQTRANLHLLKKQSLFSKCILFFTALILYVETLFIVYLSIQNFTLSNSTYRISVQSINGISYQPTSLTVPLSLITLIGFILLFNKIVEINSETVLNRFVRLMYPSIYLLMIIFYRLILDLDNLIGQNGLSLNGILIDIANGSIWSVIFILNLVILISAPIAKFKSTKTNRSYDFIGFLTPIILFVTYQLNLEFLSKIDTRKILFLPEIPTIIVLPIILGTIYTILLKKILQLDCLRSIILIPILVFTLTFIELALRMPTLVYSFRPTFQPIKIDQLRSLIFILFFSLLVSVVVFWLIKFKKNYLITLGGLFYVFTIPIEKIVIPSLDSYHYGEFIGLWFNTKHQHLQPYREIEYPRGLFVNYFPAEIGNFLSPGNPEYQTFWLVVLSYICGLGLVFVLSNWIPTNVALLLILLLPFPNNYVEIDYIAFASVLLTLSLFKKSYFTHGLTFILVIIPILILAFPGQGAISSLMMVGILFNYRKRVIGAIKLNLIRNSSIFVSIGILSLLISPFLYSAVKWVWRNSGSNPQFFGDGWVNKFLFSEDFPMSIRWIMLFIAPTLILFYVLFEKILQFEEKILLAISLLYLILISGRWFGRTDFEILSRVGVGGLTFVIVLIIPLIWRVLYKKSPISVFSIIGILFVLAVPYKIISIDFPSEEKIAANLVGISKDSDYIDYGNDLFKLQNTLYDNYGSNPRLLNLTGGSAADFYLRMPSIGGIQSPYMIVDREQEEEWLDRLVRSNISGIYGSYGSFGGIKADGSTIGGRAPNVLKWLMDTYSLVKCESGYFGFKEDIEGSFLQNTQCREPVSNQEKVDYWNEVNGGPMHLGNSLIMWGQDKEIVKKLFSRQGLKETMSKGRLIEFTCSEGSSNQQLRLYGKSDDGSEISTLFYANLGAGKMRLNSEIFPINNLIYGSLNLSVNNNLCTVIHQI